ncbi:PHD finger protein 20-like [Mercenaria mercenaria]|uniref:PHD finger protein 20-like n=1 Tax=Mercenaria mercenaria TaxID=6596 RepID=UPI00234F9EA6|nr:PHD finger protein 20-like [Mercenaria mercenaria]
MSEEASAPSACTDSQMTTTDGSSEMSVVQNFGTKLDGSLVDLVGNDDEAVVDRMSMPDGTSLPDATPLPETTSVHDDPVVMEEHSALTGFEMDVEGTDIVGEIIEEQVIDNQSVEDPLTPVTDNFDVPKSLPESGGFTPVSHSDQSLTFSSSEKGTPSNKLKVADLSVRQVDYDSMSSSSGSVKNLLFPQRPGISWRKGERLEAMDYLSSWFPAKIRAINEEDMQVLIHFDGWNQRYDEWIDMTSDHIRPLVRHSERKERNKRSKSTSGDRRNSSTSQANKKLSKEHKIGDAVYAKWTDCKMYPAKITNIMPTGSYEVIFYDGFKKLVQPINIRSMPNEYKQKFFENGKETSAEREKRQSRTKKRRLVIPGLFSDSAVPGSGENVSAEIQIKTEPVSTQTEFTDSNKVETSDIKQESGNSTGELLTQAQSQTHVPLYGPLPPKAFVVESDHNQFKCQYEGCNKGFRKEHLLDYHVKYYHINGGGPPPPPAKRRRKTTSTCSTESENVPGSKKSAGKKNRNMSAESAICLQDVKQEYVDTPPGEETGEISTQTSPSKLTESFAPDDVMFGIKQDSMEESSVTDAEDYLKPDELVNCICDFQEENGLMIQCEVCMCWQHAACFGITERTLPKTYICFVCENPPGVRESSRYIHEQDWLKTGEIASFSFLPLPQMSDERCNTVKSTHTLVVEIQQLNTVLHSLKLQLQILRAKDESKLKQWRVDWDVMENETMESFGHIEDISCKNGLNKSEEKVNEAKLILSREIKIEQEEKRETEMKAEISSDEKPLVEAIKAERDVKGVKYETEEEKPHLGINATEMLKEPPSIETKKEEVRDTTDGSVKRENQEHTVKMENETEVKQEPTVKLQTPEHEEGNNSDSTESVTEDPIEVCEKNLLSHILRIQGEISDRFDKIEEQVEMLEAMEAMQSRRGPPTIHNVFTDMPHLKRSLRNMENDLCRVKKMSVFH